MRTVYKYALPSTVTQLDVVAGAFVHHVGIDPASGHPALWAEVDIRDKPTTERRLFVVVPTGGRLSSIDTYVGTAHDHPFVWHIYEREAL